MGSPWGVPREVPQRDPPGVPPGDRWRDPPGDPGGASPGDSWGIPPGDPRGVIEQIGASQRRAKTSRKQRRGDQADRQDQAAHVTREQQGVKHPEMMESGLAASEMHHRNEGLP